jgi:hypothetical protein
MTYKPAGNAKAIAITEDVNKVDSGERHKPPKVDIATQKWWEK